jgi:hypothetical protein
MHRTTCSIAADLRRRRCRVRLNLSSLIRCPDLIHELLDSSRWLAAGSTEVQDSPALLAGWPIRRLTISLRRSVELYMCPALSARMSRPTSVRYSSLMHSVPAASQLVFSNSTSLRQTVLSTVPVGGRPRSGNRAAAASSRAQPARIRCRPGLGRARAPGGGSRLVKTWPWPVVLTAQMKPVSMYAGSAKVTIFAV